MKVLCPTTFPLYCEGDAPDLRSFNNLKDKVTSLEDDVAQGNQEIGRQRKVIADQRRTIDSQQKRIDALEKNCWGQFPDGRESLWAHTTKNREKLDKIPETARDVFQKVITENLEPPFTLLCRQIKKVEDLMKENLAMRQEIADLKQAIEHCMSMQRQSSR